MARSLDLLVEAEEREPIWAVSRDISLGGLFAKTSSPAPSGACVAMKLITPAGPRVTELEGMVRWTSPQGMGIQFGLMGARDIHVLTELLDAPPERSRAGIKVSAAELDLIDVTREVGAIFETDLLERYRARFRVVCLLPAGDVRVQRVTWLPNL